MEVKKPERHLKLVKPRKKKGKTQREIIIARLIQHAESLKW